MEMDSVPAEIADIYDPDARLWFQSIGGRASGWDRR